MKNAVTDSDTLKLEAVLNTILDGMIVIDAQGVVLKYNHACEKIFGHEAQDIVGQNVSMLMPDPMSHQHDDYIARYLQNKQPKIIGIGREVEGLRKDGSVFPMHLSVGEMNANDETAFVGIIRDLTGSHEARAKYETLQQEHFHLSRVAAMDQFATAIAHEINQPLTAVMNYMDAGTRLLDKAGDVNVEKLSLVMTKSSEQANRAAKILSRLRQFIEKGDVEKKPEDLKPLIETSVELVFPLLKKNSVTIAYDIEAALPRVNVSSVQIQQVLVNLMRNACEAMTHSPKKELTLSANQIGSDVRISVCDSGKGLTTEELQEIFKPFSTQKKGGLGVGLSICRTIITHHNGKLWAQQNDENGSCFYISLPIS